MWKFAQKNPTKTKSLCSFLDPSILFVPDGPEDWVDEGDDGLVACRTSQLTYHVELIKIPSKEKIPGFYDPRMGFIGVSPGKYQCEATLDGRTFTSAIYTVREKSKSEPNQTQSVKVFPTNSKLLARLFCDIINSYLDKIFLTINTMPLSFSIYFCHFVQPRAILDVHINIFTRYYKCNLSEFILILLSFVFIIFFFIF